MALTNEDLQKLDSAITSPASVRFADGREVRNRPMDEVLKAREVVQAETGKPNGTRRTRQVRMYSGKGF